ncbi:hypothetical protein RYH70_13995 [Alloalcanivorax xenomutans]|uniref:hypothetical protein n=1 Tax=Alloalcanivorax xenomutans TaxID=1094342 RepID=UPI0029341E0C|nr:hypothetical protein [Alloalcanivorax xenomutans]WOD27130.1 hypothetical protein RYH70_13995 [Alloalcanivorax xenomutans]
MNEFWSQWGQLITLLSTAITSFIAGHFRLWQRKKVLSGILKDFWDATSREDRHAVTMLFWSLHRIQMRYSDIMSLIRRDDAYEVIRFLRRRGGIVRFRNCSLEYIKPDGEKRARRAIFVQKTLGNIIILFFFSLGAAAFVSGEKIESLLGLAFTVFWVAMFYINEKEAKTDEEIASLISSQIKIPTSNL